MNSVAKPSIVVHYGVHCFEKGSLILGQLVVISAEEFVYPVAHPIVEQHLITGQDIFVAVIKRVSGSQSALLRQGGPWLTFSGHFPWTSMCAARPFTRMPTNRLRSAPVKRRRLITTPCNVPNTSPAAMSVEPTKTPCCPIASHSLMTIRPLASASGMCDLCGFAT